MLNLDEQTLRMRLQEVAVFAECPIVSKDIEIEILHAPHRAPSSLTRGKMAVYVFFHNNKCLKVGKVGPKSNARYTSQHYSPESSRSNLAKSLLKKPKEVGVTSFNAVTVGTWIKKNTDRVNILLPMRLGTPFLSLAEAFLQCWLKPVFEGYDSQKQQDDPRRK